MREYLLVFLVAASVTYLLTVIAREVALRTGAVAQVRDRDMHAVPIPYFGGLAMLGGMIAAYLVARELPFLSLSGPAVFRDARVVLIAGALICMVGVLDDLLELDALTKLGGQVLAAGFLIAFQVQYLFFPLPGGGQISLDPAQAALLTVLTVVATVNAASARPRSSCSPTRSRTSTGSRSRSREPCSRRHWQGPAPASSRTTSTRPGCSWATAARCCSASHCPRPR